MREFTTGYYGTGTAFEYGSQLLSNPESTALQLLKYLEHPEEEMILQPSNNVSSMRCAVSHVSVAIN